MTSHTSEVIDLYLYDVEVSDELFKRLVLDAVERDIQERTEVENALHSVRA